MYKFKPVLFLTISLMAMACNRADKRPKYDPNFVMPDLRPKASPSPNGKPALTPVAVNQQQVAAAPANAAKLSNVPLNPAHGQPGHRCDIAVGAPLGNAPVAAAAKPIATAATAAPVAAPQTAINTASVAKGMNPAHGQPGHRCDIAVGAPLNSKPAPVTTANTTPAATAPTATTAAAAPVKVAKGMNPSHGQPGHRCDIAVGAPLNSKPNPPKTVTPAAPVAEPVKEAPKDNQ